VTRILDVLEDDATPVGTAQLGEPQLGRRGLYGSIGTGLPTEEDRRALLWVLNLADGTNSLVDVAERSGLPFRLIHQAAQRAREAGLVRDAADPA